LVSILLSSLGITDVTFPANAKQATMEESYGFALRGRFISMQPTISPDTIRLSDVISALSVALDLTEGQPMGHAIRSCIVGMRIADELQLPPEERSDLYYALLLKDSGCSTNAARMCQIMGADELAAKREVKFEDWTKASLSGLKFLLRNVLPGASLPRRLIRIVQIGIQQRANNAELIGTRCERGAQIARQIGLSEATAKAIHSLDEHWNGGGYPQSLRGEEIPLLARILNVSQTVDVFAHRFGPRSAVEAVTDRRGRWFDPEIVRVVQSLEKDQELWQRMESSEARDHALAMEPGIALPASPERIDSICQAFAQVIDAKSPYTFHHSVGVAEAATAIAGEMCLAPSTCTLVRRAALLHDIGKLSVSNAILEKPGKLTAEEWMIMRMHPAYTTTILRNIRGFDQLAYVAGAHHERLDGTGYPEGLAAERMTIPARIIAVADVYQALTEKRPYRESLPLDVVFDMMDRDVPHRLDPDCLRALKRCKLETTREENALAHSAGS
jgi:putative nucleotidyltransferase with HDIG domain